MSTTAGVGRSNRRDGRDAGAEAARAAAVTLGALSPDLCLVFATSGYEQPAVLAGVGDVFPGSKLSGCSGEGIIAGPVSDETPRAVAVLALHSDALAFETFLVRDYAASPKAAGEALARHVRAASRGDEVALLVFPDGLLGNAAELLAALDASLGGRFPVIGGAAGDSLQFQRTHQYQGGIATNDSVAAVLLRGRGRLEIAISHGCLPIGLERRITRAEGAWVHEIDGAPAWEVFRQYLDGDPQDLDTEGAVHLSVGEALPAGVGGEYEPFIVRTPLGLDKSNGALLFPGGGIRSGARIRFTHRDPARIAASARACASRIVSRVPGGRPAFVLQFDCAGRGSQIFGSHVAENVVRPLQQVLGVRTPWIGFHTYGEIAPIGDATYYHNYTVALGAIYDAA